MLRHAPRGESHLFKPSSLINIFTHVGYHQSRLVTSLRRYHCTINALRSSAAGSQLADCALLLGA